MTMMTNPSSLPGMEVTCTRLRARILLGAVVALGLSSIAFTARAADSTGTCDAAVPLEITRDTVLPPDCTYHSKLLITRSNITLDCRGSRFIGSAREKIGLTIDSQGKPLSNVVVKNCSFNKFASSGVRVTWGKPDAKKGADKDMIYRRTPSNIVLDNISVEDNGGVGIYLDDYVSDVIVKNSRILRSGGAGIYLEHSSRQIKLLGNTISGNGFRDGKKAKREGVAVDSSADNLIERNTFQGNAAGGIFLYKNCGEHFSTGKQVIRWQHSDRNLIRANQFVDEPIGIWLASRQRRNLSGWDCGDTPLNKKGEFADFADFNRIENNTFCKTGTQITDNGKHNIMNGSKTLCQPLMNNKN